MRELRNKIEQSNYWDARVKKLDCKYFGDEVKIVFEGEDKDIVYVFEECYDVRIKHIPEYPKDIPSKKLMLAQIPYFMQNVEVNELRVNDIVYLEFNINMFPVEIYIVCRKFEIL